MSSLLLAFSTVLLFSLVHFIYGGFLRDRIFSLTPDENTPAIIFQDGLDYVPTKKGILFGHHFMSMVGITHLLGPAIAVIWGFVPAVLWVLLGTIFLGATHDLGSLVISLHHQGRSIGDLTSSILGGRARILILLLTILFVYLVLALSLFMMASLFTAYPQVVFPFWFEIPVALILGYFMYRKQIPLLILTILSLLLLFGAIYIGIYLPFSMPVLFVNPTVSWALLLLAYAFLSTILPVWSLLQPRDYMNFWQVFLGLLLVLGGLLLYRPLVVAPAFHPMPPGSPPIFPFLFVIFACGGISGFHSLIASGTTVKQLKNRSHALSITFGGKLLEGVLAIVVILVCTTTFDSLASWEIHYGSWEKATSLALKMELLVEGLSSLIQGTGIPLAFATSLGAMMVVSFAATTLDSATRILGYLFKELTSTYNLEDLMGHKTTTFLVVLMALPFTIIDGGRGLGSGGLLFWPLFGSINHLVAGITLLLITLFLFRLGKPLYYTLLPMILMLFMSGWSLLLGINTSSAKGDLVLTLFGGVLFILEIWIILEAVSIFRKLTLEERSYQVSSSLME